MTDGIAKVRRICEHWPELTREEFRTLLTPDCDYLNVPMPHRQCTGPDQAYEVLATFAGDWTVTIKVRNMVGSGDIVLTERVERFTHARNPGKTAQLNVMGAFELRDGQVFAWRDYFDSREAAALSQ